MTNDRKSGLFRWLALALALSCLFALVGCGNQQPKPTETTGTPAETTAPKETEPHTHSFTDGLCQCGESNGLDGLTVQIAGGLSDVVREDTETGMTLTSSNAAGQPENIRLTKELDGVYGRYYEMAYIFESNVAGTVRFVSEGAAYYETNEFEVKAGENEIVVRFAAGKSSDGKLHADLELGALEPFTLNISSVTCKELTENLNPYFLDVADQATGTMEKNADGHLAATFHANEGWRVKLAADRALVKGKTYETTFVFTVSGGKAQNVTYTVYDGAATVIGSKTKWVEGDVCVATFYLTANESVTKGTCLELGQLCDGKDVNMTFTYVDFKEVDADKLAKLEASNPFPGVNVWTEGSLAPASGTQSAEGLTLINTNPATDWWKVKLEKTLQADKGKYYRIKFTFNSNAAGRIKYVNDDAAYYGANEYDVVAGENTFCVEFQSGGNSYSCLELGGLGPCELLFTEISVEEIDKPADGKQPAAENKPGRFRNFRVWTEPTLGPITRGDTETVMALLSYHEPTDWWKVKLETDINGKAGQCYEATFTFTSNVAGRIKFVNDGAVYFGSNEYDVVEGDNVFTVQFKHGGNPYTCLELGGLGKFHLMFTNYTLKEIEEPEVTTNGFENYKGWTEASMKPLTREDGESSMTLISENEPGDWWKVKLETNFPLEAGKTYLATFKFTSTAAGDMKFGTNEKVICHTGDIYAVTQGENTFAVTFTAAEGAYTCLELGGLGPFKLTFTEITLKETVKPEPPAEHEHSFTNGLCQCGESNGFAHVSIWTEGSLTPMVREDTENTMIVTSANASGDWWKVKVEWPLTVEAGKTYEATFAFTSDAAGTIKYSANGAEFLDSQEFAVVAGENTFKTRFTAGAENYSCLELGGLGAFKLTFTDISLKETEKPAEPDEPDLPDDPGAHTHNFVNGKCECGEENGFAGVHAWTHESQAGLTRVDTENTMTLTSTNASCDWWMIKLEYPLSLTEGKNYEVTFKFTSNAVGPVKYSINGASNVTGNEFTVQNGENAVTVSFTAGAEGYSCLEMGGLGAFELTFTEISLKEVEKEPDAHTHSFANGVCECGADNGFLGLNIWTEESLTPVVRTDTENTMTITSANAPSDWWKVKVEYSRVFTAGTSYEATFKFSSNVAGTIKYNVNEANYLSSNEYSVKTGDNTFTVQFTAGADGYTCLELGGLGEFELIFTEISIRVIS